MNIFFRLFILLFIISHIHAKEPTLAKLVNIISNDTQEFKIGKTRFLCLPYGVVTVEEMYRESKPDSTCRKSILAFYKKKRDLQYYTHMQLSIQQFYPVLFKNKKCIVSVVGEKSLSELLLENGLAVKKPQFKDKEYRYYFDALQQKAREGEKGLWGENIHRDCVSTIYID